MIEDCLYQPKIYTRLIHRSKTNTKIYKILEDRGLLLRRLEFNDESQARSEVYMVYATPKGKEYVEHVNRVEELMGIK